MTPPADAMAEGFSLASLIPPGQRLTSKLRTQLQGQWRSTLAEHLYGDIPPPPQRMTVERLPLPDRGAEHLRLTFQQDDRQFSVDAALWLPQDHSGPLPLICGLDFVGPAGVLLSEAFPLDPAATIYTRPELGADGTMTNTLRGTSAYRWPIPLLCEAGYAVLVSSYGSWAQDCAERWQGHGVAPLMGTDDRARALSLWAWAYLRLLDAAATLPEVDGSRMAVAGHSRLGKAALWAAANDSRIRAVFANQSGCGGAAPARHRVGETLAQMEADYPHWTRPGNGQTAADDLPFDQHMLLASIAPRAVYLACAEDDLWADPVGSYEALCCASTVWGIEDSWPHAAAMWSGKRPVVKGALGYHLRPGGHDLLPLDWRQALAFLSGQMG